MRLRSLHCCLARVVMRPAPSSCRNCSVPCAARCSAATLCCRRCLLFVLLLVAAAAAAPASAVLLLTLLRCWCSYCLLPRTAIATSHCHAMAIRVWCVCVTCVAGWAIVQCGQPLVKLGLD
ncbi:hypothetical protein VPH35_061663 [Triticum aestivum]